MEEFKLSGSNWYCWLKRLKQFYPRNVNWKDKFHVIWLTKKKMCSLKRSCISPSSDLLTQKRSLLSFDSENYLLTKIDKLRKGTQNGAGEATSFFVHNEMFMKLWLPPFHHNLFHESMIIKNKTKKIIMIIMCPSICVFLRRYCPVQFNLASTIRLNIVASDCRQSLWPASRL